MQKRFGKGALLSSALAMMVAPQAAVAADNETESDARVDIIVTASKRSERLADVGQSLTAVSGAELEQRNLVRIEDFAAQVPGLAFWGDGRSLRPILRGVNSGGNGALVAVNIDETPFSYQSGLTNSATDTANIDAFDMARIEVLKGPQGTLYGASASGGLIKYVTNAPNPDAFEARGEVGGEIVDGGNAAGVVRGVVNIPLVDGKVAFRATGLYREIPGYINNPLLGSKANSGDTWALRLSLLAKPTETFTIRLTGFRQDQTLDDNNMVEIVGSSLDPANPPDNVFEIANGGNLFHSGYMGNPSKNRYEYANLTMDLETGFASFLSSTSYGRLSTQFRADASSENVIPGLNYGQYFGMFVYGLPTVALWGNQENSGRRWNQEFRMSSLPDSHIGGLKLDWQVGGFYAFEDITFDQFYDAYNPTTKQLLTSPMVPGGSTLPGRYEEFSGFASTTLYLMDTVDVSLAGRYADIRQRSQVTSYAGALNGPADIVNPVVRSHENKFTWSAGVRWRPVDDSLIYARVATGYRPGGPILRIPGAPDDFPASYKSDSVINYELGYRGAFLNKTIDVDVAVFYLDWTDMQVLSDYTSENTGQVFTVQGNAGSARSTGVEWNIGWSPIAGLRLSSVGAYTDAKITEDAPTFGAANGDPLPLVPKWSNTVNLDYEVEFSDTERAYAGISWTHTGVRYANFTTSATDGNNFRLPPYNAVNAQAGIDLGRYSFSLYVRNIGNSRGITDASYSGGANMTGTATFILPRTAGIKLGFTY